MTRAAPALGLAALALLSAACHVGCGSKHRPVYYTTPAEQQAQPEPDPPRWDPFRARGGQLFSPGSWWDFVLLLNNASTSDQSRIEKWTSTVYALGF